MGVAVPIERCYYYECQNGSARLTQFIPAETLKMWIEDRKIDSRILNDYPDGVDLDCTEADFDEFTEQYQFVHPFTAEQIQNTFFAIFSTTKNWKNYRGSGLMPAEELESQIKEIEKEVTEKVRLKYQGRILTPKTLKERNIRQVFLDRSAQELKKELIDIPVKKVDSGKTIQQQRFGRIKMSKGDNPEKIFMALNQRINPKK